MDSIEDLDYLPKRNRSCFVYGCFSTAANKPSIGFHKIPERGERNIVFIKKNGDRCIYDRRQVWINALNIGHEASLAINGIDVYVCSLHFARDDFYYNQDITGRRYLKEFAIPRRNLPVSNKSPLTTKYNVRTLNRRKYRGYCGIHNPDGRKLTARRRFLGAAGGPSYSRTVWVVRKPKDAVEGLSVAKTFSLADQIQTVDEVEDEEQCSIVDENSSQPGDDRWLTSELIIKEEPVSDIEQESSDAVAQKAVDTDTAVSQETVEDIGGEEVETIDDDEEIEDEDNSYEPNKLVIQTEDEDVEEEEGLTGEVEIEDNNYLSTEVQEEGFDYYNEVTNGSNEDEELPLEPSCDVTIDNGEFDTESNNFVSSGKAVGKKDLFVCLVCSVIFPSHNQLALHSSTHHLNEEEEQQQEEEEEQEEEMYVDPAKYLTCEFCGRVLSTKSTLREHIMIHTGEKPHECLLCGAFFRHKANLVVHVNSHAVVSTYKCKKCNKAFTKKLEFEKHLKIHVDSSGKPLFCFICNTVFKSQRTLYNHSLLHSRKGSVRAKRRNAEPKSPVHVCKHCGKVLSTKATLKEHEMIHSGERPHVCNICGRSIRHKANFVVHVQTHGQGKSYECDMCDEAFMRKSDLTQHKQAQHSKSKLLRCPICLEVFKSPQKFNRHMEIHESVVYMNETEEMMYMDEDDEDTDVKPHMLESFLEDCFEESSS